MRAVLTSDWHGNLPDIPACDLLIVAGDLAPDATSAEQAMWLRDQFLPHVLERAERTVFVWGNHDFIGEEPDQFGFIQDGDIARRVALLQESHCKVSGVSIYGTPWVPHLPFWAFYAKEEEIGTRLSANCPPGIDILVSHGPPHGAGDQGPNGRHVGSTALAEALQTLQPKLVVCGHIHENYGSFRLHDAEVLNVSEVDSDYQPQARWVVRHF